MTRPDPTRPVCQVYMFLLPYNYNDKYKVLVYGFGALHDFIHIAIVFLFVSSLDHVLAGRVGLITGPKSKWLFHVYNTLVKVIMGHVVLITRQRNNVPAGT
ncbi:hypothetical protein Hdeb2414_s0020g00560141 [Helianthus debilis subsp. tardiflorus]